MQIINIFTFGLSHFFSFLFNFVFGEGCLRLIPREWIIDPDWSFHSMTIKVKLIEIFDFKYFFLVYLENGNGPF